ncbi:type I polyketide synthase [Pendulispora rubella]|uniref:Type I polyketide synthase n=1 Tax=Pendulispora rubella TaxID=2741070 RepID=A0ABZ2L0T2_9BACT
MSMLNELQEVVESLTPEQRTLLAELLAGAASTADEPIAIVGMAGRFPGAPDVDAFWQLLVEGRDAISEIPRGRWNADAFYHPDKETPGKMATRWGGFLEDVERFDAEFFGITPREAAAMDPQQRLFLETAWEALEDAGLPTASLRRTATGVFVGVSNFDYVWHQFRSLRDVDAYASSGSAHCIIANRISYLLDLTGPSVAVDTACSSSLVAVHLACQSLRAKECDLALAGGVNLVLTPHLTVSLSRWGMMASDGRCKTFDSRADGFVRGEGSGAVVLQRLVDAEHGGARILAVIRGSAINQDGKTNGLTAPNGAAQQAVIRQALARAGVSPADVSFLETHGTGTSLGDPIEVEAIHEVFGGHTAHCVLGAVKTNIGHLEPAAGIAGLIKVVLALRHGTIPRNLHFQAQNPHLTLAPGIELANETRPWAGPRMAGVSAFSFGGTNAHVVLEEAPARALEATEVPASPHLLALSARDAEARRQMAVRHAQALETAKDPALTVEGVAALRALHRDHLDERLVVLADGRAGAAEALRSFAEGRPHPDVVYGSKRPNARCVFVYTGQGQPWLEMGRELWRTEAVFREAAAEVDAAFQRVSGRACAEGPLERTDVAQPAIFRLQIALTKTLAHWGIRPDAVVGHSVGEVAAAWAAGILTLDEAARVVHHRARLMERTAGLGAMASVAWPLAEAAAFLEAHPSVVIAAHNGARDVVLSGYPEALEKVLRALEARGARCKKLAVAYAFHSPQMDALQGELVGELQGLRPKAPRIPFFSTVTGQRERDAVGTPEYWAKNMRERVRFAEAIAGAHADGCSNAFLELGPHPALTPYITDAPTAYGMRRGQDDRRGLLSAVASLYVHGIEPDWSRLVGRADRRWSLPAYPWQRQRHWLALHETASTYRTEWIPDATPSAAVAPKRYHLVADDGALAEHLRAAIQASGGVCAAGSFDVDEVLLALPSLQAARAFVQRLLDTEHRPRVTFLTRAAMHLDGDAEVSPELAALWGFGRALAHEEPSLGATLLDLPASPHDGEATAVLARLAGAPAERQAAWRKGQWHVPRLTAYALPSPAPLDGEGTFLVTGGLGSLGLATAQRLVSSGAKTLALVARRAPNAEQRSAIAALQAKGARVMTVQANVADAGDLARALEELRASAPPLRGVFHAAGVLEDGLLAGSSREAFDRVLSPKVEGGWNLHRLTKDMNLQHFVLYSSATAVLGAAGQTSYAAANAFLQGLAEHRRALGLRAVCVHWGAWAESSMASDAVMAQLRGRGFDTMAQELALDALEGALRDGATDVTVVDANWKTVLERHPLLERFLERLARAEEKKPSAVDPIVAVLAATPAGQRAKVLYGHVRAVVLSAMGMHPGTDVRPDQGLVELGLDSLLAVTIANRFSRDLAQRLPKTLIYDHPTLQRLTEHLLGVLFPPGDTVQTARAEANALGALAGASHETIQSLLDEELASLLPSAEFV